MLAGCVWCSPVALLSWRLQGQAWCPSSLCWSGVFSLGESGRRLSVADHRRGPFCPVPSLTSGLCSLRWPAVQARPAPLCSPSGHSVCTWAVGLPERSQVPASCGSALLPSFSQTLLTASDVLFDLWIIWARVVQFRVGLFCCDVVLISCLIPLGPGTCSVSLTL